MRSGQHPRNLLLQALPAAEFEALRPRLELFELVKDTVLVEAGAPSTHVHLPHSGVISMVRLSEGQSVDVVMIGVQRNAVSIVAHALQKAGMIRYSRGHIEITDADRLLETTCECYRAVKAKRDRLLKPPN